MKNRAGLSFLLRMSVIAGAAIGLIAYANVSYETLETPPTSLLFPPQSMKAFTLGYDELLADLLWIRAIQDFDLCEQSDRDPGVVKLPWQVEEGQIRAASRCNEGWVYHMIDRTTELAPKFKSAYKHGGTMLSILVDDRIGAQRILERGVREFPDDWEMHYRLGYHYLYELHDLEKAAVELKNAAEKGAPAWIYPLVAKLYSKAGQIDLGISMLERVGSSMEDSEASDRIQARLRELKAMRDSLGSDGRSPEK